MKIIYWLGPERIIPGYGYATKGAKLLVPPSMAESFVFQGIASYDPPAGKRTSKSTKTVEK